MFKSLTPTTLGISGRQSELIELALTYGFGGLEVDIEDMLNRAKSQGVEQAGRFLTSAKVQVGGFELPVDWQGTEVEYRSTLGKLGEVGEVAGSVGSRCCTTVVPPTTELPYNEAFEQARQRIAEMAEVLAPHGISIGLDFRPAADHKTDQSPFIQQAEALLTLLKTIASKNVGLSLDTWNWYIGGGASDQLSELEPGQIVSLSMADAASSCSPGNGREEDRRIAELDGTIDNVAVLRMLSEQDYEGPISLAASGPSFDNLTRDVIVQKTSTRLDELLAEAGLDSTGNKLTATVTEG